jgi:hypothetical protein
VPNAANMAIPNETPDAELTDVAPPRAFADVDL